MSLTRICILLGTLCRLLKWITNQIMKRFILFTILFIFVLQAYAQSYVDLGLPSGTLWKDINEDGGLYTHEQAMSKYGFNSLPSIEQLIELRDSCHWVRTDSGYIVYGPNNNYICMPLTGYWHCVYWKDRSGGKDYYGSIWSSDQYYWSRSELGALYLAYSIGDYEHDGYVSVWGDKACDRRAVRLVKGAHTSWFVDLGLPSGTLWKNRNEKDIE